MSSWTLFILFLFLNPSYSESAHSLSVSVSLSLSIPSCILGVTGWNDGNNSVERHRCCFKSALKLRGNCQAFTDWYYIAIQHSVLWFAFGKHNTQNNCNFGKLFAAKCFYTYTHDYINKYIFPAISQLNLNNWTCYNFYFLM